MDRGRLGAVKRVLISGLLVGLAGCKGERTTAAPPEQPDTEPTSTTPPSDLGDAAEVDPPTVCASGGTPWDGRLQDCPYEVGRCCYESPAQACAAATCPESRCQVLESYPAQIACRDDLAVEG